MSTFLKVGFIILALAMVSSVAAAGLGLPSLPILPGLPGLPGLPR